MVHLKATMKEQTRLYLVIMIFYATLTFLIVPGLFYMKKHSLQDAGIGYLWGSALSMSFWIGMGQYGLQK